MSDSIENAVEAFEEWCEGLAAPKARNAVPGEPAPPSVNGVLVSTVDLVRAFENSHPEHGQSREELESFALGFEPGLEVDRDRWKAILGK